MNGNINKAFQNSVYKPLSWTSTLVVQGIFCIIIWEQNKCIVYYRKWTQSFKITVNFASSLFTSLTLTSIIWKTKARHICRLSAWHRKHLVPQIVERTFWEWWNACGKCSKGQNAVHQKRKKGSVIELTHTQKHTHTVSLP